MKKLKITYIDGIVSINSDDVSYALICGKGQEKKVNVGLKLNSRVDKLLWHWVLAIVKRDPLYMEWFFRLFSACKVCLDWWRLRKSN